MSSKNLEYLYEHLPSRFRREDKDLFLKRYLQWFGETLDGYDDVFDSFFENINPGEASETWVEFWLENLFGWSWFPAWFTLADKRRLYGNFAGHLARRGTARGIELWLADFRISTRVNARPAFVGDWIYGEPIIVVGEPLVIIVAVESAVIEASTEMQTTGEAAWGEGFYIDNAPLFTSSEFNALLRYVQPQAQEIIIIERSRAAGATVSDEYYWESIEW